VRMLSWCRMGKETGRRFAAEKKKKKKEISRIKKFRTGETSARLLDPGQGKEKTSTTSSLTSSRTWRGVARKRCFSNLPLFQGKKKNGG